MKILIIISPFLKISILIRTFLKISIISNNIDIDEDIPENFINMDEYILENIDIDRILYL